MGSLLRRVGVRVCVCVEGKLQKATGTLEERVEVPLQSASKVYKWQAV